MQRNSDLDVRRLAARMGAALPAYRSFRNSPVWTTSAPVEAAAEIEAEPAPVEAPPAAQAPAAMPPMAAPAAHAEIGIATLRALMAAPAPEMPPPTTGVAPPAGGFPLIEAALAARPQAPAVGGSTLAALRDRLANAAQPMGQ